VLEHVLQVSWNPYGPCVLYRSGCVGRFDGVMSLRLVIIYTWHNDITSQDGMEAWYHSQHIWTTKTPKKVMHARAMTEALKLRSMLQSLVKKARRTPYSNHAPTQILKALIRQLLKLDPNEMIAKESLATASSSAAPSLSAAPSSASPSPAASPSVAPSKRRGQDTEYVEDQFCGGLRTLAEGYISMCVIGPELRNSLYVTTHTGEQSYICSEFILKPYVLCCIKDVMQRTPATPMPSAEMIRQASDAFLDKGAPASVLSSQRLAVQQKRLVAQRLAFKRPRLTGPCEGIGGGSGDGSGKGAGAGDGAGDGAVKPSLRDSSGGGGASSALGVGDGGGAMEPRVAPSLDILKKIKGAEPPAGM
jgi:hypothetical protein